MKITSIRDRRRQNLKMLVEERFADTAARLAEALGWEASRVSGLIGKTTQRPITDRTQEYIERILNLPIGWLDKDHSKDQKEQSATEKDIAELIDKGRLICIKSLDVELSAGTGAMVFDDSESGMEFVPEEYFKEMNANPERCCVVRVKGDCMQPEINSGDKVIVDLDTTAIYNGAIYSIRLDGVVMVKRLYKEIDGGVKITCDNVNEKAYFPDLALTQTQAEQRLTMIGEVIVTFKRNRRRQRQE